MFEMEKIAYAVLMTSRNSSITVKHTKSKF
jgi:hypothetical protein